MKTNVKNANPTLLFLWGGVGRSAFKMGKVTGKVTYFYN